MAYAMAYVNEKRQQLEKWVVTYQDYIPLVLWPPGAIVSLAERTQTGLR
jgi:hypothetical protein